MGHCDYRQSWSPRASAQGGTGSSDCGRSLGCAASKSAGSRPPRIRTTPFSVADKLVNQTFEPTRPNEVWVTDITDVMTDEGWLYLAGVKDVLTCELVGYVMGPRMTQDLTAQALWRAMRSKRSAPGLIHHSDRGTQYCAGDYRELVAQFRMQASMSRKGSCYDKAPMESFWGSLKNEMIHHQRYATRANAEAAIKEYIEIFYNASGAIHALATCRRPHLPKISIRRDWLLETDVSTIDRTPHSSSTSVFPTSTAWPWRDACGPIRRRRTPS